MNRNRFCKIQFCENEFGTKDQTVKFFRAPMDGELSNQWIDQISKHNSVVPDRENLNICQRHFKLEDFIAKHCEWVLKKYAVPSVFGEEAKSAKELPKLTPSTSTAYKSSLQGRRYCKIKYCEHEVGTNSKEISFFGVPMNGQKRLEWIQAISRYQEFDFFSRRSSICRQHFKVDDIIIKNGKYILKKQALPSIFPGTSHLDDDSMQPQLIDTNSIHYELLTDGKRFCRIEYCPNEKRTNKDVSFFRAPMVGDLRVQWIDMISGHQQNDTFSTGFMVCELHFLAEHFIVENGRKILKKNTIPSIFDIKPNTSSDCDSPVGANDSNKLHDFEFVSFDGSYPIIKNEPLDESTNSDQKRIFVPETVEEHSCATHNVAKRAKTSVLACDSCDDLNTELQKAREKIVLLEKFIQTQNKMIRRQRNTIIQLRK